MSIASSLELQEEISFENLDILELIESGSVIKEALCSFNLNNNEKKIISIKINTVEEKIEYRKLLLKRIENELIEEISEIKYNIFLAFTKNCMPEFDKFPDVIEGRYLYGKRLNIQNIEINKNVPRVISKKYIFIPKTFGTFECELEDKKIKIEGKQAFVNGKELNQDIEPHILSIINKEYPNINDEYVSISKNSSTKLNNSVGNKPINNDNVQQSSKINCPKENKSIKTNKTKKSEISLASSKINTLSENEGNNGLMFYDEIKKNEKYVKYTYKAEYKKEIDGIFINHDKIKLIQGKREFGFKYTETNDNTINNKAYTNNININTNINKDIANNTNIIPIINKDDTNNINININTDESNINGNTNIKASTINVDNNNNSNKENDEDPIYKQLKSEYNTKNDLNAHIIIKNFEEDSIPKDAPFILEIKASFNLRDILRQIKESSKFIHNFKKYGKALPCYLIGILCSFDNNTVKREYDFLNGLYDGRYDDDLKNKVTCFQHIQKIINDNKIKYVIACIKDAKIGDCELGKEDYEIYPNIRLNIQEMYKRLKSNKIVNLPESDDKTIIKLVEDKFSKLYETINYPKEAGITQKEYDELKAKVQKLLQENQENSKKLRMKEEIERQLLQQKEKMDQQLRMKEQQLLQQKEEMNQLLIMKEEELLQQKKENEKMRQKLEEMEQKLLQQDKEKELKQKTQKQEQKLKDNEMKELNDSSEQTSTGDHGKSQQIESKDNSN